MDWAIRYGLARMEIFAHVPEKWAPVFRQGHAQTENFGVITGTILRAVREAFMRARALRQATFICIFSFMIGSTGTVQAQTMSYAEAISQLAQACGRDV